jgi:hypothetical protein
MGHLLKSQPGVVYTAAAMRPLAALLTLCTLALGAGLAVAAPFAAPEPPLGLVAPGTVVVTEVPGLPRGSYELELFLVPEGGAPIRVSAELSAGTREIRWRMPAVAARRARLVLRAGGEGEERESAPSAPFELAALPPGEVAKVLRGRSEAGVRIESAAGAAGTGLCAIPDAPSLEPGGATACASEPAPAPLAAPCERAMFRPGASRHDSRPVSVLRVRSNSPAFIPLRN